MTPHEAIAFISQHGVVLEAAGGAAPSLVCAIAGGAIGGSWWSHPRGKEIFRVTRAVRASREVLVCRLVSGKVTFVHCSLWPALVRSADHFQPAQLARLIEEHTESGRHVVKSEPFPDWVPSLVLAQSLQLSKRVAFSTLSSCLAGCAGAAFR
ncbi:MAG TPA: hypothetical protein VGN24_08250 [Rhodanobacter sp.]|nr:hypothetical protein [Rhodanobacter sp.]